MVVQHQRIEFKQHRQIRREFVQTGDRRGFFREIGDALFVARQSSQHVLQRLAEILPDRNTPQTALENGDLTRILNEFLLSIPQTDRNIFVCRYWYLDPIAKIAKGHGFTQSKVKSMLARTRKKLKTTLEKEGISL